jgi:hypothetical protein
VLPAVIFLSAVTAWTGWIFLEYWRRVRAPGAGVLAGSLLLWAIHHLDYPFLRAQGTWSPWGYYLDVLLLLSTICGITILVLDDLRGGMRALTALAAGTAAAGSTNVGLLAHAIALPAARGAALYRFDETHLVFAGGVGRAERWADVALPTLTAEAVAGAMSSGKPTVRPDLASPDGTTYAYTAILPLACRVAPPQALVVAGDTRDPFAALDASFLTSLGTQLASALDSAELLSRLKERSEALVRLSTACRQARRERTPPAYRASSTTRRPRSFRRSSCSSGCCRSAPTVAPPKDCVGRFPCWMRGCAAYAA